MNPLKTRLGLFSALIAILAVPPVAAAEYLVPPGNSAVTQYTESFPTAGGDKDSEKVDKGDVSPAQTIGKRNAKRLEAQGEDGIVVAEVAAETAPAPTPGVTTSAPPASEEKSDKRSDGEKRKQPRPERDTEVVVVTGGSGGGNGDSASGSSGLGEIFAQATGVSSGQMGLLLPLAILCALAWALAFLWRQRNRSMA